MTKYITSSFWKFSLSDVLFNNKETDYVVFQLGEESFTLPKHQIHDDNGTYDFRVKYTDKDQVPKIYKLYNNKTKTIREVGVEEFENLLKQNGYKIFEKPKTRKSLYL